MNRNWRLVVPVICMCLALGCSLFRSKPVASDSAKSTPPPTLQTGAYPVVVVPEPVHKFGKEFSEEVAYSFLIKNTGDAPLEIKKVYPD